MNGRDHKHVIAKTLWQQYLMPKAMYAHACLNFTKSDIQALTVEENKAARDIIKAPIRTNMEYVKREANIGEMRNTIVTQKVTLLQHLLQRKGKLGRYILEHWNTNNDHLVWIQRVKEYLETWDIEIKELLTESKSGMKKKLKDIFYEEWRRNASEKGLPQFYLDEYSSWKKKTKWWMNSKRNATIHFWMSGSRNRWLKEGGICNCVCEAGEPTDIEHLLTKCVCTEALRTHQQQDVKDIFFSRGDNEYQEIDDEIWKFLEKVKEMVELKYSKLLSEQKREGEE